MDASKDYYAILGVLPSIEQTAIKAVYLALLKKYHPDVYPGDKAEAERITKDLNEAFGVLGDNEKRKQYDLLRKSDSKQKEDYQPNDLDDDGYFDQEIESSWILLCEYFNEIDRLYRDLKKISNRLSFVFKIILVSQKLGTHASELASLLKEDFLNRYFSSNIIIQKFALQMIAENQKEILLELNRVIRAFGTPTDHIAYSLIDKILLKFRNIDPKFLYITKLFQTPIFNNNENGQYFAAELKNGEFVSYMPNSFNSKLAGRYHLFSSKEIFIEHYQDYYNTLFQFRDQRSIDEYLPKYIEQIKRLGY